MLAVDVLLEVVELLADHKRQEEWEISGDKGMWRFLCTVKG